MWIAMNNGFVSITQPRASAVPARLKLIDPLQVRARKARHLTALFPGAEIFENVGTDYQFRVFVERTAIAERIAQVIGGLNYDNFKNSVREDALHDAYSNIWGTMMRYASGGFDRPRGRYTPSFLEHIERFDDFDDEDDFEPEGRFADCSRSDCRDDYPCPVCIQKAIDEFDSEPANIAAEADAIVEDRYGDFDSGDEWDDDSGATSHLRVPPTA